MLLLHIGFSLGLIALVAGASLYLWSVRAEAGAGIAFAKVIGIIVIILSIIDLLCTIYGGIRMRNFYHNMRNDKVVTTPVSQNPSLNNQSASVNNLPVDPNNPTPNASPAEPSHQ